MVLLKDTLAIIKQGLQEHLRCLVLNDTYRRMGAATGTILLCVIWVGHACLVPVHRMGGGHTVCLLGVVSAQAAHRQILRASSHISPKFT